MGVSMLALLKLENFRRKIHFSSIFFILVCCINSRIANYKYTTEEKQQKNKCDKAMYGSGG
jgi:hypothetical protein